MREELSRLLAGLRSTRQKVDQGRAEKIERACTELQDVIRMLEAGDGLEQPGLSQKLVIVLTNLAEADVFANREPLGLSSPNESRTPDAVQPTKDLVEWARRQFTEEEFVAGIREIREKGGLELCDFIHELEH